MIRITSISIYIYTYICIHICILYVYIYTYMYDLWLLLTPDHLICWKKSSWWPWPRILPKDSDLKTSIFFSAVHLAISLQNLEDWDGLLLGAVQIVPQAQAREVEPWCCSIFHGRFHLAEWPSDPQRCFYPQLHTSAHCTSRLFTPWILQWQASNNVAQPPAPPNVPQAWAALSFLHMALWWTETEGSTLVEDAMLSQSKVVMFLEVPSEK